MAVGHEFPGPPDGVKVPTVTKLPVQQVQRPSPSSRLGLMHSKVLGAEAVEGDGDEEPDLDLEGNLEVEIVHREAIVEEKEGIWKDIPSSE